MDLLGKPYKIVYEARNLASGLTGIVTNLITPTGSIIGPFGLAETAIPGVYSFTLSLPTSATEGTYTGVILSPNEGNYSRAYKINFVNPETVGGGAGGSGGQLNLGSNKLLGKIKNKKLTGSYKVVKLKSKIKSKKLSGIIKKRNKLVGKLLKSKLRGVLKWNH